MNKEIVFYHHRDKTQPRGGITYALAVGPDELVRVFAMAKCHEKDNFVKKVGRAKAAGRLRSAKHRIVLDLPVSVKQFIEAVNAQQVTASKEPPSFVR